MGVKRRILCVFCCWYFCTVARASDDKKDDDVFYDCYSEESTTILSVGALSEAEPFPWRNHQYATLLVHSQPKQLKNLYKIRIRDYVLKPCSLPSRVYRITVQESRFGGYVSYSKSSGLVKLKPAPRRTKWKVHMASSNSAEIKHHALYPITLRMSDHRYIGILRRRRQGTAREWNYFPVLVRSIDEQQEFIPWCSRKSPSVVYLQVFGAQRWLTPAGKELIVSSAIAKGFTFTPVK